MAVVGFVTRSGGSNFFSQGRNNVGGTGGVRYVARQVNGTSLGNYQTAGQALRSFQRLFGPSRIYNMRRRDLPSNVEHYEVICDPPDPPEVWPNHLALWVEPSVTNNIIQTADGSFSFASFSPGRVRLEQTVAARRPLGSAGGIIFPNLDPTGLSAPRLRVNSESLDEVAPPFTLIVTGVRLAAAAPAVRYLVAIESGSPFYLGDNGAGNWRLQSGASFIDGPAISTAGSFDYVTVVQDESQAELRVNGVSFGVVADAPDPGPFFLSNPTNNPWIGSTTFVSLASLAGEPNQIKLAERYVRDRYC